MILHFDIINIIAEYFEYSNLIKLIKCNKELYNNIKIYSLCDKTTSKITVKKLKMKKFRKIKVLEFPRLGPCNNFNLNHFKKLEKLKCGGLMSYIKTSDINKLKFLRTLNISKNTFINDLNILKNLEKLDVSYCTYINIEGIRNCNNLKFLNISGNPNFYILNSLSIFPKLEYLECKAMQHLDSILNFENLDSLKVINLSNNSFDINSDIRVPKNLKKIIAKDCNIKNIKNFKNFAINVVNIKVIN